MVEKTTLSNGVRILSQKMPHVQSVSLGVWVNAGSRDEAESESGLSHFIEHMIFKGTKKRTAFEIAKAFDSIGGYTNAFTSMENTCYHAKVMVNHINTMTEILTDIFLNSLFDEAEIEKERPVIFQEISMMEETPDDFIHQLAAMSFWGDCPLGRSILGSRDNILKFDSSTIQSFFKRLYQPDRIVISAAGNIDHGRLLESVCPAFETITTGNEMPVRTASTAKSSVNVYPKDIEQVHICLNTKGLSSTDPGRYALSIMNTIIGGNMSSRLFQQIREQQGLAYSVYSFISSFQDVGTFGAYAAVDPSNVVKTVYLIMDTLKDIKNAFVTEDELRYAKEFTRGNLLMSAENNDNLMSRLAQNEFNFGRHIPIEEILNKIDSIRPDDILMLAENILQKDMMTLVLHGPVQDVSPLRQVMDAY